MPDPSVCVGDLDCDPNLDPEVEQLSFGWVFVR